VAHPFIEKYSSLDPFDEIVLGDSEFIGNDSPFVPRPGELYEPVAYAWKELRSGQFGAQFGDELSPTPPHRNDDKTLYFGFTAAEPEFFASVGWQFASNFIDLRVESINLTNRSEKRPKEGSPEDLERPKPPRSLIDILISHGVFDGDAENKKATVQRILKGYPFNRRERRRILHYCFSDVLLLEKLLEILLPLIRNFKQALNRGEYVKLSADIFAAGQPADPWAASRLRCEETRRLLRLRAVSNVDLSHGLYNEGRLRQAAMDEFVIRHHWGDWWRLTGKTKRFGKANRDFEILAERYPEGHPEHQQYKDLPDVDKMLKQLREFQLIAGKENRYRSPIWAFSTISARMAPNGAAYPFTTPAWTRYTIMPEPGTALAYLDFASMEFGVAAGLSQCPTMLADYSGEPYLLLPRLLGYAPANATRLTHNDEREQYKPMILAVQYEGGAPLLARRLNLTVSQGQRLIDLHHDRYSQYWEWSDGRIQRGLDDGELITKDGWRCGVSSKSSLFTMRNWLIQANSASIFRYACLMMRKLGIRIIAVVHDAVLVEAPADLIEEEVARATICLERASRRFLRGLTLRVDTKIIREGQRFEDKRGAGVWAFVERTLQEMDEGKLDAAG